MNLTQKIRLSDVLLIGPFLIIVGGLFISLPIAIRITLILLGVMIIAYNGYNFMKYNNPQDIK